MRIGELICEKFALILINRRCNHQLQQCQADRGLLEYNRDRLYERYEKWKNKTHAECQIAQNQIQNRDQNIFNLQRQILALQNNPPQVQHIGMAGYPSPKISWHYW